MKNIASVTYLPPCYCKGGKGKDLITGRYIAPRSGPVFVRVRGRLREVRPQWRWLFRPFAAKLTPKDEALRLAMAAAENYMQACQTYLNAR